MSRLLWTLIGAARASVFVLWTLCLIGLMYVVRMTGRDNHTRWRRLQRLFRVWARVALCIMNVRLQVFGSPPQSPCLLASNHLGYLDIVVFAATFEATFVSKLEVASWPLLGPVVSLLGTIFVDREKPRDVARVNALIQSALDERRAVIVFPEGTSSDGQDVLPLRPSLLRAAEDGRHPLHYARLAYQTNASAPNAGTSVCWWGDADFLPHAWGLFQLPRVDALLHFGAETVPSAHRKELAVQLHDRIRSLSNVMH
ncbi:MAG: lysophospholipid acyltransferase family protein [Gammaproteobacteria bacterium]